VDRRALAVLPEGVGQVKLRADAGYFAVELAIAAHREGVGFAIGAKRIAPLWRTLAGIPAAGQPHQVETNTSMTWPYWSIARYR
jgi:hypothetical protein